MDGMIAGKAATQGTVAPFFFMLGAPDPAHDSDISKHDPAKQREVEFTRIQIAQMKQSLWDYGGYLMLIPGINHGNFSDAPFFSISRNHTVIQERLARIISRYTLAFFDKHLKGIGQPLLDGPSVEIPEVRFESWRANFGAVHHE